MARVFLIIGIILIILWLLGFVAFHFTTPVIHLLIVVGVILIIIDAFSHYRNRG